MCHHVAHLLISCSAVSHISLPLVIVLLNIIDLCHTGNCLLVQIQLHVSHQLCGSILNACTVQTTYICTMIPRSKGINGMLVSECLRVSVDVLQRWKSWPPTHCNAKRLRRRMWVNQFWEISGCLCMYCRISEKKYIEGYTVFNLIIFAITAHQFASSIYRTGDYTGSPASSKMQQWIVYYSIHQS